MANALHFFRQKEQKTVFSLSMLLIIVWGCGNNNPQGKTAQSTNHYDIKRGEALFASNCNTCHQLNAGEASVAPHAAIVKEAYSQKHGTQADFINAVSAYAAFPDESKSLLPEAIKKYGIMAGVSLPEADLRDIAAYWHQVPLAMPEPQPDTATPQGKGLSIALRTKAILGKNLTQAINKKGVVAAIAFCNTQAMPLTDSMSIALQSTIRRVSDKPRNPINNATPEELSQIEKFKKLMAAGTKTEPVYAPSATHHKVYYPIPVMAMCLQCHGKKDSDISTEVQQAILAKYPKDKATGYSEKEMRGMWVIEWPKNPKQFQLQTK